MAINDDFEALPGLRAVRFTGGFDANTGRPLTTNPAGAQVPYTGRQFAAWLADAVDEINPIREIEALNPLTNSSFELAWYMDPNSFKALYGASMNTTGWTFNASRQDGVTMIRWDSGSTDAPQDGIGDRGVALTQAVSGATGVILYADTSRRIVWVRNSNGTQFDQTNNVTGTGVDMNPEAGNGNLASGEDNYLNLFTSGVIQPLTEIRIGQYDDRMGGDGTLKRITPWWNARSTFPFVNVNPSGVKNEGQIDILLQTQEAGRVIDNRDVYGYGKKWGNTSAFGVLRGGIGRDQIVLETNDDSGITDGYANALYDGGGAGTIEVGDIIRIQGVAVDRAIVTSVTDSGATGDFDYYLIGPGTDFADNDLIEFFDDDLVSQKTAAVNGAPTAINAATYTDVTYDFGFVEIDIDNGDGLQPYAVEINPATRPFSELHSRNQYLTRDLSSTDMDAGVDQTVEGQWYRGIGESFFSFDAQVGTYTEGEYLGFNTVEPSGTATTADANGETLEDTTATFVTNGVQAGDFVLNITDNSFAIVLSVTSETVLEHTALQGGTNDDWTLSDAFVVTRGLAVLTSFDDTGDRMVLRDIRGPALPVDNDEVTGLTSGATAAVNGAPATPAENRAAPYGSLAGVLFTAAQGVGLTPANLNSNDATNYSVQPLVGQRITPPNAVTVSGIQLNAGDRPFCSEVQVAGQPDLVKNHYLVSGTLTQYGNLVNTTVAVGNNRASAGDLVLVDVAAALTDNNKELRYRYSSRGPTGFTLTAAGSGTATSVSADGTQLIDTGADFGGADDVQIGDVVNNETDGSLGIVAEIVSTTELRLESIGRLSVGLTDGTNNDWGIGDTYSINTLARAYANGSGDTIYVPYFNSIATASEKSAIVVHSVDVPVVFRNRFASGSDPSVKIKDDVQFGTVTASGVTFTARQEPNAQAA